MRAAVLGHPIAHSLSPVLHRAAYRALGLDWTYDAVDVRTEELAGFLAGLGPDWAGLSLTMPLKQQVVPLLDTSTDLVRRLGSANTVVLRGGVRSGHNTDVAGVVHAIREARGDAATWTVGVVGAGATAAAAVAAAGELGARVVLVSARRPAAVTELLARFGRAAGARGSAAASPLGPELDAVAWAEVERVLRCDCVIVALPGDAGAGLADAVPSAPGLLLDVTYDPWPTTLAAAWRHRGGPIVPGHRMLLWQAVRQVELMTGRPGPYEAMAAALAEALA